MCLETQKARIKRKILCLNLTTDEIETQGHIKGEAEEKSNILSTILYSEFKMVYLLTICIDSMCINTDL